MGEPAVEVRICTVPLVPVLPCSSVAAPATPPMAIAPWWVTGQAFWNTNRSVASLPVPSPRACVVPVTPLGNAGVPDRFPAVPVVFWFRVGKLVNPAAENTGAAENVGTADEPVKLPNTVLAEAVDRAKLNAGVVVPVATDVVNRGDNAPAVNDVTVPVAVEIAAHPVALPLAKMPVGALPVEHSVGVAVKAPAVVAVAALPVVLWFNVATRAAASVPLVILVALAENASAVTIAAAASPLASYVVHPVTDPDAKTPVGADPAEHRVGVTAKAVAVAALPVVL